MANGNGAPDPLYARLTERVENQGQAIIDLRSNMNTGFRNVESAISQLSSEFRGNSKTQWPVIWSAIGVSFAILLAVGSQALSPIRDNLSDLKARVDGNVPREEIDWRAARGAEDRTRTDAAIADLRASDVSRAEWQERNRARDGEITELGRRIDEVRQAMGSVYGTRDVLLDLRERLDRLERDRIAPRLQ